MYLELPLSQRHGVEGAGCGVQGLGGLWTVLEVLGVLGI